MTLEELEFIDFCIFMLADKLKKPVVEVYKLLTQETDLVKEYLQPCYDVLHTQGKDYIVVEIIDALEERGISVSGDVMKLNYNILHRLVSMCIKEMVRLTNLSVEDAFNIFYQSETVKLLEDEETLYFTYSPTALAYVCLEEKGFIQIKD